MLNYSQMADYKLVLVLAAALVVTKARRWNGGGGSFLRILRPDTDIYQPSIVPDITPSSVSGLVSTNTVTSSRSSTTEDVSTPWNSDTHSPFHTIPVTQRSPFSRFWDAGLEETRTADNTETIHDILRSSGPQSSVIRRNIFQTLVQLIRQTGQEALQIVRNEQRGHLETNKDVADLDQNDLRDPWIWQPS